MFSDSYAEFCSKAEKAAEVNKGLKFPRYCKNLRFSGNGIYSYGAKIANIDLAEKTIQRMGYWSPTSSKHYNYAGKVLQERYGFLEKPPPSQRSPEDKGVLPKESRGPRTTEATVPIEFLSGVDHTCPLIHVQHLSYDDHT